jgi:hypothetical protein
MDSESIKLQFPKLSSTNYRLWSTIIKLVLANKDLIGYIEKDLDYLIDAKTWELTPTTPEVVVTAIEASDTATSPSASSTTTTSKATDART